MLKKKHLKPLKNSVVNFAHRFADLAKPMAEEEKDKTRARELQVIEKICRRVPENPATSFHEAVQSIWFVHLIQHIESNGHSVSLGRIDQYLYPYYQHDLENGIITRDFAKEIRSTTPLDMVLVIQLIKT